MLTDNDRIKSAVAAVVLAGFNLLYVLGFKPPEGTEAGVTTALVMIGSYFAPRIQYMGHRYAGSIGAVVGGLLMVLNLITTSVWEPGRGIVAGVSTLLVALGALFVPSLTRAPST